MIQKILHITYVISKDETTFEYIWKNRANSKPEERIFMCKGRIFTYPNFPPTEYNVLKFLTEHGVN